MNKSFSCLIIVGLVAIFGFVAFIVSSGLLVRAEKAFGPPSPSLTAFQRWRIGLELGLRKEALLRQADPNAQPVRFDIALNESTNEIVSRLWFADLILEGQLFSNYLFYTGLDTQLQAGSYELSAAMSSVEIAHALIDPTPESVTLVILPGWRLEEIAAALQSAGVNVTPENFLLAAWDPPAGVLLPEGFPDGATLEGYLLPGSHEMLREYDARRVVSTLLGAFRSEIGEEFRAGFEAQGLSLHQAVLLASIVERESVIDDEMHMIASVFINRLNAGMRLEADPTVQYAVGYDEASASWWKTPLTSADLLINSPYNTYLNAELPPGPIAAPSFSALDAVAFAESSPYYFFQAACDGSGEHVFAVTFEEHLANNCN